MAFVSLKAWRARSAERSAVAATLKQTLIASFGLGPDDTLSVNEIACPDPGCPDMETVVLVMRAGRPTRALRVRAPMDAVTPEAIAALVAEEKDQPA